MSEVSYLFTPKFQMNEIVYLITDVDQKPRMVTAYCIYHFTKDELDNKNIIEIEDNRLKYFLNSSDNGDWYYAEEITKKTK